MKQFQPEAPRLPSFRTVERVANMTADERRIIWQYLTTISEEKRSMIFYLWILAIQSIKESTPEEKKALLRKYRKNRPRYNRTVFEAVVWVIMQEGLSKQNAEAVKVWKAKADANRNKKYENSLRRRLWKHLPEVAELVNSKMGWKDIAAIVKRNHREFRGEKITGKYLSWVYHHDYTPEG